MRVLHLYSNHKWTGPADHALNLVAWLQNQAGVEPHLACGYRRGRDNWLQTKARERRLSLLQGFHLVKHFSWRIAPDVLALRKRIGRGEFDLLHSHQDIDSLTVVLAGCGRRLVHSVYAGEPWRLSLRQRLVFSRAAKIVAASVRVRDYLARRFPGKDVRQVDIPVDLQRFAPQTKSPALLAEFDLAADRPVGGIVARVQKNRRFDLLLAAIKIAAAELPQFKFLIIGRGTAIDELARAPVQRMGLQNNVVFTGYRDKDYSEVLNLLDFKVFLQPGSDGACRAAREALACGIPVIATRRGILPELIADGQNGLLVEEKPEALARALVDFYRDDDLRIRCADNARDYACRVLDPARYVGSIVAGYEDLLEAVERRNKAAAR